MSGEVDFKNNLLDTVGIVHQGKNSILDKGVPFDIYKSYLYSFGNYIHLIKLGWTTWALFSDRELEKKISLAKKLQIPICLGGTLFEIAYTNGLWKDFIEFIVVNELDSIELASGFAVSFDVIPDLIKRAKSHRLSVLVEIGFKDENKDAALSVEERISQIRTAFVSGADYVVLEAREQGSGYSVYQSDKSKNEDLISAIQREFSIKNIIFEAPLRANQIYLVNRLGSNVNMGNIVFDEIPRVETIRRKLHASTYEVK